MSTLEVVAHPQHVHRHTHTQRERHTHIHKHIHTHTRTHTCLPWKLSRTLNPRNVMFKSVRRTLVCRLRITSICICVTWLIRACDVSHTYVCSNSFICVTCLIHMCDTTHSTHTYPREFTQRHHSFYMCDMTHLYMWHASFVCVTHIPSATWTPTYFPKTSRECA